jgi:hypothetical protein
MKTLVVALLFVSTSCEATQALLISCTGSPLRPGVLKGVYSVQQVYYGGLPSRPEVRVTQYFTFNISDHSATCPPVIEVIEDDDEPNPNPFGP